MSRTLVWGALLVVSVLAVGAGQVRAERPAWIEDPAGEYSPADYLVGVGSAGSEAVAVDSARADLAAGFRARVRSTILVQDDADESFSQGDATLDRSTRMQRTSEIRASEVLANVTIGRTWFDESADRHHALVFIKRSEACRILDADIRTCVNTMIELLECGDCYPDAIAEYAGAVQARTLHRDYDRLNAQLRVVSEGRAGHADAALGSRVSAWVANTAGHLTLAIAQAPPELEMTLRDVLLDAGFAVGRPDALFTAELVYATSEAPLSEYCVFEYWEMSLRIRRSADGSELITLNRQDRAGHKTRKAAIGRCLRDARTILRTDVVPELELFFAGGR